MIQTLIVEPKKVGIVRFRAAPPHRFTVSVESTESAVWVLALSMDAYDLYLKGKIQPPTDPQPFAFPKPARDLQELRMGPGWIRHPGVLAHSPPVHTFAAVIDTTGRVGWWYLLVGNRREQPATVYYDVWE